MDQVHKLPGIDTSKANIARVYDYWLGGSNNFVADQDAARAMIAVVPNIRAIARANRAFLGRAVRFHPHRAERASGRAAGGAWVARGVRGR